MVELSERGQWDLCCTSCVLLFSRVSVWMWVWTCHSLYWERLLISSSQKSYFVPTDSHMPAKDDDISTFKQTNKQTVTLWFLNLLSNVIHMEETPTCFLSVWCGFSDLAFSCARWVDSRDDKADYGCECFSQHIPQTEWHQALRFSHRQWSDGR